MEEPEREVRLPEEGDMKRLTRLLALTAVPVFALVLTRAFPGAVAAQSAQAPAATCGQACLARIMDDFVKAMTTGQAASVALAPEAEIRENAKTVTLDATAWKQVKAVRSIMTFADPVTGNVVSRAGVELADGKPGYISTRLKVAAGGRLTDVEMSSDTSPRVVSAYVWNLDPVYSTVLPAEQRMARAYPRRSGPGSGKARTGAPQLTRINSLPN